MEPERLGRGPLWDAVRDAVGSAGRRGRALWLRGDAGIGKTVLLEQTGRYAAGRGLRVLRATGSEEERELPFGVLHQLLWALPRDTGALSGDARAALDRALGVDPDAPGAPYPVSAATADLLASVARSRPLALLVDDLHWTDDSSAEVLQSVQRRLDALPVVLVAALRRDTGARLDPTGAEVLDLTPLTDTAARAVLGALHPDLADAARDRVVQEAAGNPLALVELPARLAAPERSGRAPLPDHLPLGERLEAVFADRFAALSARTRFTLLVCALAGRDAATAAAVGRAVGAAGGSGADVAEDLRAAEHAGLIRVDHRAPGAVLRFRHPLARSALVAAATAPDRRRAHAAWAAVLPADGLPQATHRAAATAVADERTAAALERAAARSLTRAGDAEAAQLLVHAARLSEDTAARGRRLTAAASAAVRGGRIDLAGRLLERIDPHEVPPADLPVLQTTRALVRLQTDGDLGPAVTLLPGVLDRDPGPLAPPAYLLLLFAAGYSAEPEVWAAVTPRLSGAPDLVRLGHDVWHDPARRAHGGAGRLAAAVREFAEDSGDDAQVWLLLWCAAGLDAVGDHAPLWERLARRHSYATRSFLSAVTAYDDYLRGHWDRSVGHARAGAALARARGYRFNEYVHRYKEGYVRAARGEREAVDALVAELLPWAEARGLGMVVLRLRGFQAMCALAQGDPETAWAHAVTVTPPGTLPPGVAQFHLALLDLVEAAVLTGRTAEARRHTAAARAAGADRISPHHAFVLRAAEALAADDPDTGWTAVRTADSATDWPFELARVRFHLGSRLRRRGRRAEARDHLRAAHEAFEALGAGPWTARAAQELRVCDEPRGGGPDGPVAGLSPQELRITELVADGLTNRDIGTRLQISPRTVSSHLYRIYPKLGVTSRAAVARALTERDSPNGVH